MADINTKLFIVEGPPCSGKSETARFIADTAKKSRQPVSLFDENDMNHPADYAFHAFMTEDQIRALSQEERRQLYAEGFKVQSGYVIPLTKVSVSLFGKVIPYKIYDRLAWETERPVILAHWKEFSEKASLSNRVNVFNSCFLQNPLGETMMRFDFGIREIRSYIEDIYRVISKLNPVVIYLRCTDIKARVEEISEKRTAVWLNTAITYHTSQAYGIRNGLTGFDGYIACLEARQKTELEILDSLPVRKLILTDPFGDWEGAYDEIRAFIAGKRLERSIG